MTTRREFLVTLITPDGAEYDITWRTQDGSVVLHESIDYLLTEIAHDDMDLDLDDRDGFLQGLFKGVDAGDVWQVRLQRETGIAGRWETLFVGILDLPESIREQPLKKLISMQAFSQSKLLENASAEAVRRNIAQLTVDAAGTVVTYVSGGFGVEFGFLQPGDSITITNYTTTETRIVSDVVDLTTLHTTVAFPVSFDNAVMTLDTPYMRNLTVAQLVARLFNAAGITDQAIDAGTGPRFSSPVAQPINAGGISPSLLPVSLAAYGSPQKVRVLLTDGTQCDFANFVDGPTVSTGGPVYCGGDSWPHAGGVDVGIITRNGKYDNGEQCWDYNNVEWYVLQNVSGAPVTPPPPTVRQLRVRSWANSAGTGFPTHEGIIDGDLSVGFGTNAWLYSYLDHEAGGKVWCSFKRRLGGPGEGVSTYDPATDAVAVVRTDASGQLRFVRGAMLPGVTGSGVMVFYNLTSRKLEFYDSASAIILATIDPPPGDVRLWTFRWYEDLQLACVLVHYNDQTRLYGWNTPDMSQAFDHVVAATQSVVPFLTGLVLDGVTYPFGYAGGNYFVLANSLVGVIPYADFSELSVQAALKDLALLSGSCVDVSVDRVGRFRQRSDLTANPDARVLGFDRGDQDAPLQLETRPLFADYRPAVEVKATGLDGTTFDPPPMAGDRAKSAKRLTVTPSLRMTESMGLSMASAVFSYVGQKRAEATGKWDSPDAFLHPLDQVQFRGETYQVVRVDTDVRTNEQTMRLVQIVEVA